MVASSGLYTAVRATFGRPATTNGPEASKLGKGRHPSVKFHLSKPGRSRSNGEDVRSLGLTWAPFFPVNACNPHRPPLLEVPSKLPRTTFTAPTPTAAQGANDDDPPIRKPAYRDKSRTPRCLAKAGSRCRTVAAVRRH